MKLYLLRNTSLLSRTLTTLRVLASLWLLGLPLLGWGQTVTIFNETFGNPGGTTTLSAYAGGTAPATFSTKPNGYTYGPGGAANPSDIRATSASSGYGGASGSGNTFFTSANAEYGFAIGTINASGYTGLALSFGLRKEAASAYTLIVDYSTDGTTYTPLTVAGLPGSTAATGWYGITGVSLPAAAQVAGLTLRFRKSGTTALRLDDVILTGTAPAGTPSITTTGTLTAFSTPVGTPSAAQSYTLTGSNLTADVAVAAPAGFEVSQTSATAGFAATQTVPQANGSAAATLYVRLTGATAGTYIGSVANTSTTASASVAATGNTVGLTVTPASLSGFSTTQGTPSVAQTYALTGAGLSSSVTVTAPGGYEVAQSATSATTPGTYAASLTVTSANATAGRTIYVRLAAATAAGTYGGNVTNAATGATTQPVAVTGTVGAPVPTLALSAASLPAFNTLAGTPSAAQRYTLAGSNLTADVTVTAPAGYEVSQTSGTTGFAPTQTVPQSGGTASATLYVRLTGATAGTPAGDVTNATAGATTQPVAVTGTVVGKPSGTPTIAAGTPTFNAVTLSLGAADGTNLLVLVRPAASPATAPTDQTTYTGNTILGAGSGLGAGFVVFAAPNASGVTVTGLAQGTAYAADVYTYNAGSAAGFESYGPASGTSAFTTPVQPAAAAGLLALEENFDYPSGTQLANSPTVPSATTGWYQNGSATTNAVATATGNLSSFGHQYPQGVLAATPAGTSTQAPLATSGQDVYKTFAQPTGATTVYAAALLTLSSAASGDYFLHFINNATPGAATTFRARLYARAVAGSTTAFNLGLQLSSETFAYSPVAFSIGTTYLVVLKYENSAATGNVDNATLFVLDPAAVPVGEPNPTVGPVVGTTASQATLNAIALRQGSAGSSPALTVDAVRVASGWGAAVGRLVYGTAPNSLAAGDYYSLRVTGVGAQVSTSGPVRLEKQLNLDGGQVATSAASPLVLRARPLVGDGFELLVNAGGTSFVDGPVAREAVGGPSLLFPIGRNGNYRPLTLNITTPPAGTTTYTAVQTEGQPADQTLLAPLTRISRARYFSLTPSPVPAAGVFTGTVALSFGDDDGVTDPSLPTFVVAKSDGTGWNNLGRSANTATSLTSDTFQDFSDFVLASTEALVSLNPLPVQLTSFGASRTASGVQVAWATAAEVNSARFVVERSLDGRRFAEVTSVAAQGSPTLAHRYGSLDATAPAGPLYYRLRQVDRDGTAHYSPAVAVAGSLAELTLAPNPTRASLSFFTEAATAYTLRNPLGQVVRTGTTLAGANTLAVEALPAGVYLFELHTGAGRVVRRFVKE